MNWSMRIQRLFHLWVAPALVAATIFVVGGTEPASLPESSDIARVEHAAESNAAIAPADSQPDSIPAAAEALPKPPAPQQSAVERLPVGEGQDRDSVRRDLYAAVSEIRIAALDAVAASPSQYYGDPQIAARVDELADDENPDVAELAGVVSRELVEELAADDGLSATGDWLTVPGEPADVLHDPAPSNLVASVDESRAELEASSEDPVPGLLDTLSRSKDPELRGAALQNAVATRDERYVAALKRGLVDEVSGNRLLAIDGLVKAVGEGWAERDAAAELLEGQRFDADAEVSLAVESALKELRHDSESGGGGNSDMAFRAP